MKDENSARPSFDPGAELRAVSDGHASSARKFEIKRGVDFGQCSGSE